MSKVDVQVETCPTRTRSGDITDELVRAAAHQVNKCHDRSAAVLIYEADIKR